MSLAAEIKKERFIADLEDLEKIHEAERSKTAGALDALEAVRNRIFVRLVTTGELFRYLTWKQRETINNRFLAGSLPLEEIHSRAAAAVTVRCPAMPELPVLEKIDAASLRSAPVLRRMDTLRKNITQFGIIQKRAAELSGTLAKALPVFDRQYSSTCRALFPYGFFSRLRRSIRRLLSHAYFSWQDLNPLKNLGMAAGFVLKMAEAPLF